MSSIVCREVTAPVVGMPEGDAALTRLDPFSRVTLRFALTLHDEDDLEALRYARRVMIREERTRGLEWEEPSMEQPVVTAAEIRWVVPVSQIGWCREKIAELVSLANRAREELE